MEPANLMSPDATRPQVDRGEWTGSRGPVEAAGPVDAEDRAHRTLDACRRAQAPTAPTRLDCCGCSGKWQPNPGSPPSCGFDIAPERIGPCEGRSAGLVNRAGQDIRDAAKATRWC